MANAITDEGLRSIHVWSSVYCGNNSTALSFRAYRNKPTGMEENKSWSALPRAAFMTCGGIGMSLCKLSPTSLFLPCVLSKILVHLFPELLNSLSVYDEVLDAPVNYAERVCERLKVLLTTPWAGSLKQSSLQGNRRQRSKYLGSPEPEVWVPAGPIQLLVPSCFTAVHKSSCP